MVDRTDNPASGPIQVPPPRRTGLTLLLGAVILLSGMAIGFGAAVLAGRLRREAETPTEPPRELAARIASDLAGRLDLEEDQRERLEKILVPHVERVRFIRKHAAEQVLAEREKLRSEVEKVLSPEQMEQLRKLMERGERRAGLRDRGRHGRPHPWRSGRGLIIRFDRDGDGRITEGELPDLVRERLMEADADGDGVLTEKELDRHMDRRRDYRERSGRRRPSTREGGGPRSFGPAGFFRRFDADGDGRLRKKEVPERLWPWLSAADADADGVLTEEELRGRHERR